MVEVLFIYEGSNDTIIQCDINDKMKDIIKKFENKINNEGNNENNINLLYIYNGSKINPELTFNEQANELDKNRKKMNIITLKDEDSSDITKKIRSEDIICPECKENIFIDIKKFKINLHDCKNKHNKKDMMLNSFKETQTIELSEIICEICNNKNKTNTPNNEFYICNTCNKKICPSCKSTHAENHKIINYDDKNYICNKHNESYCKYCEQCKEHLCLSCETDHNKHKLFDLGEKAIEKNELLDNMKDLKNAIDNYKYKVNVIKEIFDRIINLIDTYYEINNNIINNYDKDKLNYYIIKNTITLKENNEKLIKDINEVVHNDKITDIFEFATRNFYNDRGDKYIGEMNNDKKNGKGVLYFEEDDEYKRKKYEGDFKDDIFEGKGIIQWVSGSRHVGDFKNGKFEGKGITTYINGNKYDGDYKNNKREGKGIFTYSSGDKYEGDWKDGKKEGKGIMIFKNGDKYEGDWSNDKFDGKGIFRFKNGDRYEGDYKNDLRDGNGIMYYSNGSRYEGEYKGDKKEGNGIIYFKNGEKYEGFWKDGKKEGKGIMYYKDGKKEEGVWKKDKFSKK